MPIAHSSSSPSAFTRVAAIIQAILAAVAAFGAFAFWPDGQELGADGIAEGFRWSFISAFAVPAALWIYGAVRTWRAARLWWLPLVAGICAAPLLFVLLAL